MSGYSGTPLAKKLGIKPGYRIYTLNAPGGYTDLLAPLPAGVEFVEQPAQDTDLVHFFTRSRAELASGIPALLNQLKPDAVIWVSWPKKASKVPTDVTEDVIREVILPLGLVDVKVAAVDQVWSGLKLVLRLENRGR